MPNGTDFRTAVAWFLRNHAERGAGHDVRMTLFESLDLTPSARASFGKTRLQLVSAIGLRPQLCAFATSWLKRASSRLTLRLLIESLLRVNRIAVLLHDGLQFLDDLRILGGVVSLFADVVLQVGKE